MKSRIFISKALDEIPLLENFCTSHEYSLYASSLIRFEKIPFNHPIGSDIVCFTSPRSVEFYFQSTSKSERVLYACVGNTTAKKLSELGISPSFVGSMPGDPQITSDEFAAWAGTRTVLFPESNKSLGSLSMKLNENQFTRLPIYRTSLCSENICDQDIYIFTSPSNAESFFSLNSIPPEKIVIAWGKSTERYLKEQGISVTKVLVSAGEEELVSYLKLRLTSQ